MAAQIFRATEPVSGDNPGQVAGALDRALQDVLGQLVRWANARS
jgi:ABC-type uncharacterized transport system auxiliary subunit